MSTCPFCSEEIAANSAECPSCGMELPGPSPANVGDAPPVQPSKSNAKKWILIGGAGCGFCLLILACLAAFLLPMVSRARDAVRKQAAEAAARNDQFPDSDEQLMEMMESGSSEDDSGSGDGPVPLATTVPSAETAPGSQPESGETSVQAADDAVAALKKLDAKIKENEQGEVVEVNLLRTRIIDAELVHLKGLTKLQSLDLYGTKVTDVGLADLKGLTNLKVLFLSGPQITDAGLVHLKGMTKLVSVQLNNTKVTDTGVADLQKALPNCKISK